MIASDDGAGDHWSRACRRWISPGRATLRTVASSRTRPILLRLQRSLNVGSFQFLARCQAIARAVGEHGNGSPDKSARVRILPVARPSCLGRRGASLDIRVVLAIIRRTTRKAEAVSNFQWRVESDEGSGRSSKTGRGCIACGGKLIGKLGVEGPGGDGPARERLRCVPKRGYKLLAGGAGLDVSGNELGLGGREFAVEVGHDFFWREWMCGGAHRRMPFWGIVCATVDDAADSADWAARFLRTRPMALANCVGRCGRERGGSGRC